MIWSEWGVVVSQVVSNDTTTSSSFDSFSSELIEDYCNPAGTTLCELVTQASQIARQYRIYVAPCFIVYNYEADGTVLYKQLFQLTFVKIETKRHKSTIIYFPRWRSSI